MRGARLETIPLGTLTTLLWLAVMYFIDKSLSWVWLKFIDLQMTRLSLIPFQPFVIWNYFPAMMVALRHPVVFAQSPNIYPTLLVSKFDYTATIRQCIMTCSLLRIGFLSSFAGYCFSKAFHYIHRFISKVALKRVPWHIHRVFVFVWDGFGWSHGGSAVNGYSHWVQRVQLLGWWSIPVIPTEYVWR